MGKVYLVGAGPGDPELLTLKAYRVLRKADVILYDALVDRRVLDLAKEDCLRIYVGKRDGKHTLPQEEINRLMERFAFSYKTVVRLKGGDPFVFGRGGEEVLFLLSRGIEVEVVPGVSSALAAPSSVFIPLTHRGVASSFAVVNGHPRREDDWKKVSEADTIVFLMGVKNRQSIAKVLVEAGKDPTEPVAFIEKATTPEERVIFSTLRKVAEDPPHVNTPAVMVVGKVVSVGALSLLMSEVPRSRKDHSYVVFVGGLYDLPVPY